MESDVRKIRKSDMIIPIVGYCEYVIRNWEDLKFSSEQTTNQQMITRYKAIGLCFYHFGLIPAVAFLSASGIEKLIR